jgi:hypothetical protein
MKMSFPFPEDVRESPLALVAGTASFSNTNNVSSRLTITYRPKEQKHLQSVHETYTVDKGDVTSRCHQKYFKTSSETHFTDESHAANSYDYLMDNGIRIPKRIEMVEIPLQHAVEVHRVMRRRGSHIF